MLVKVKIFDDVSGEEEEAVIVVPDEAEEEELLQNEEFIIRPCRLYEVSSKSSYYPRYIDTHCHYLAGFPCLKKTLH